MLKKKPWENRIDITFNNNFNKTNNISLYFNTKMDRMNKVDADIRKLYLPTIQRKVNQNMQIFPIKLVKSQSQENIYIPLDNTQLKFFSNDNIKREKLIMAKLSLMKMEAKINEMNNNYKKLIQEREENIKMIKEIIISNNSPNKEILLKIQYLLENKNKKPLDISNLESIKFPNDEKYNDSKTKNFHANIKINISPINALNDKNNYLKKIEEEKNKNSINKENKSENQEDKSKEKENVIKDIKEINNISKEKIKDIGEIKNNIEEKNINIEEKKEDKNNEKINGEIDDKDKEVEKKQKKKKERIEYVLTREGVIKEIQIEEDNKKYEENINKEMNLQEKNNLGNEEKNDIKDEENINKEDNMENFSAEIKEENIIKINTVSPNNSKLNINNNTSFHNNNDNNNDKNDNNPQINNSIEEPLNVKDVIEEEKDEDKFNEKDQSAIFGKSFIFSKVFTKMKVKSELSQIKHQIINIQQKLRLKEDEIEDIKHRTTMKSLKFQSNMLNKKMIRLQKIKTKNQEFEYSSIPLIRTEKGNLINELDYYTKKNKSYLSQNKGAEESYLKVKNEFDDKNKSFTRLELKSDNLKYKYNSLKLRNVKRQRDLDNLKKKIDQIESMKLMLENDKKIRDEKKKEIEETKKKLDERIEHHKNIIVNKDKKYQEMIKIKKEIKNKIGKQKNEINNIQKNIKEIEKKILFEIDKFQHLTKNNKTFINLSYIYQTKSPKEFIDYLKELEKLKDKIVDKKKSTKFHGLLIGGKLNFYKIALIKNKPKEKDENILTEHTHVLDEKLEYFINSKGELELQKDENDTKKKEKEEIIGENNDKKEEKELKEENSDIQIKKEEEKKEEENQKIEEEKKEEKNIVKEKNDENMIEEKKEEKKIEENNLVEEKNDEGKIEEKKEEKKDEENIDKDKKEKEKKEKKEKRHKDKKDKDKKEKKDKDRKESKEKRDKKSKKKKHKK